MRPSKPGKVAPISVVIGYQRGDADATDKVRRRVGRILAFHRFRIPPEDRRDLEQTVMVQLWQAAGREPMDEERFWKLVHVITGRRCIDWLRTRGPLESLEPMDEPSDSGEGPLAGAMKAEKVAAARRVLARLPEGCRQLIELHLLQDMTYAQIARRLGKTEGALRVQMHRCIRKARLLADETKRFKDREPKTL